MLSIAKHFEQCQYKKGRRRRWLLEHLEAEEISSIETNFRGGLLKFYRSNDDTGDYCFRLQSGVWQGTREGVDSRLFELK